LKRNRILVTGFTGQLGRLVAVALQDRYGIQPQILVRPHHLSEGWLSLPGMEVRVGDYTDPPSLAKALQGAEAVFLVSPVHPDMRARELALVEQVAAMPEPPHIVKISGLGTGLDSFVNSGRWHAEIEQKIRELSLPATFLRPLFFMQNMGLQVAPALETGILRGAVQDAAIAMVDARDIADVAAAVLVGGSPAEGQAVALTGARALTYQDIADTLSTAFGKPVRFERQSDEEMRTMLSRLGQPEWHIDIVLQYNRAFEQGWASQVSDAVEQTLGREPRTLECYFSELAATAPESDD